MNDRYDRSTCFGRTHVLKRRSFLRLTLSGLSAMTATAILAACGSPPAPTPESAPATALPPTPATASPTRAGAPSGAAGAATARPASPAPAASPVATAANLPQGGQVSLLWRKPRTLQPLFSNAGAEQEVERLIFGALLKMTDSLMPMPDLAEKIDAAPDAKTYTFTLRQGLTFNDGRPFTAADVVFTIERAVDKRTGSPWRGRLLGIAGAADYSAQKAPTISGLTTPDARTVKFELSNPDAAFLPNLGSFSGLGILPAHILKDVPPDQLAKHPFSLAPSVSAGAFEFVKYETDQYLELRRNDKYAGKRPPLDRIFLKLLTPDVALAQLDKGELDVMALPESEIARIGKNPQLSVATVASPSISQIGVNTQKPAFKDPRVRQAMMYAIDREGIVKAILGGQGQVVNSPIIGPDWMGAPEFNPYRHNVDKARSLLKAAGWDPNLTAEMHYVPGSKAQDAYAPIIQQQLRDAGMKVNLLQVDTAEAYRLYITTGEFDLKLFGGGVYRVDPSISATYYESKNMAPAGVNGTRYSNPKLDSLYAEGRATSDLAQRKKAYTEVARILNEDLPTIFLWSPNSIYAFNKRLVGFKPPSYIDNQLWNAEDWAVTR